MSIESWIALVLLLNLSIYMNLGGTDFGGRYLSITSSGPRVPDQLAAIARAIGPMWAVNHLLFLLAASLLFAAFPVAVEVGVDPLAVPISLMFGAVGLRCTVLVIKLRRGSGTARFGAWRVLFGVAGVVAPLMLGVTLGAMASGEIQVNTETMTIWANPVTSWLAPFPLAFGGFLLSLCALSAAVRVLNTTDDPELLELFRRRALRIAVSVGALGFLAFLLSVQGAPHLHDGLSARWWSIPFQLITGGVAVGAIFAIWRGRDALASVLVMAQITLIVWGWGLSNQPYLVYPDLVLGELGGRLTTLRFVLGALVVGTVLLFLSFWYPRQYVESDT